MHDCAYCGERDLFHDWRCKLELMPTVLRNGPYRFYFWGHEPDEPPHIHVDRDNLSAKFWLEPVNLARNHGFRPPELRQIQRLVEQHQNELLEAWHDFFGDNN